MGTILKKRYDIVVNGGGALGLWLAFKAARAGFTVCLVERALRLAGGPSTRNEGWCHAGTYHAAAIGHASRSCQVARQTRDGYRQILSFAPEAIENHADRSFAVLTAAEAAATLERWNDLNIPHRPVDRTEFDRLEPNVRLDLDDTAYEVDDRSINTRVVYAKLVHLAQRDGAEVFLGSEIESADDKEALLRTPDGLMNLHARLFVHTSGHGTPDFFARCLGIESSRLHLGFAVSHLADIPRVSHHNVFYTAPSRAGVMHHGRWSIVGLNADGNMVDRPALTPIPARSDELYQTIRSMFREVSLLDAEIRACTKVFCTDGAEVVSDRLSRRDIPAPQLGISRGEPFPGHIWALPGKMTESPFMADRLIELIESRVTERSSTPRPSDPADGGWRDALKLIATRPIDERPHNFPATYRRIGASHA